MSLPPGIWQESFRVRSYELTAKGELAVPALCNYLQEAAGRHAGSLGVAIDDLLREGLTWVLARIDLVIERCPASGETIQIETWPSRMRSWLAQREFLVSGGEETLARATSSWLVIDVDRRRPVRIPDRLAEIPLPARERALEKGLTSIPRPESPAWTRHHEVSYGDLDVNRHVNHVSYVRWALDSLPAGFHERHRLRELEVEFKAEINYPAAVVAQAEETRENANVTVLHHLRLEGDGTEAALLRTRWRAGQEETDA